MKCNDFFPYGVSYYRPVTPLPQNWDKDLANIAAAGMNTIRVSAFWSRIEKVRDQYDFAEFDAVVAAAARHGLRVLMTLYVVNMPEWMFQAFPDSRMVSAGGRVQYSEHHPDAVAGGWPGLCMDDPRVMERMLRFVRAITLHYKGNGTLLGFDVIHEPWEEPTQEYYIDSWKNAVYCYCPHSVEKFRGWLKEKYRSLEALNAAWSRSYSDWAQVEPPRNFGSYPDWLDWRTFSTLAVAGECRAAGEEVRRSDPGRLITNHTGGILNAFSASSDNFALAGTVDVPGMSNYSVKSPPDAGMSCDITRTAGRAAGSGGDFWVGETSGGSGPMFSFIGEDIDRFFAFAAPWTAAAQRKHIWKLLAHGAKGILYWMWRPELCGCETAAMGFTDREGNPTDRVAAARGIADVIRANREFFLRCAPEEARAATLYSRNASILEGYVATARMTPGKAGLFADFKDLASLGGVAALCTDNSLPMDVLNDELLESGALGRYGLLLLPYAICIGKAAAQAIRAFVEQGGTVVADALCGYFTEDGWGSEVLPANGLDEVFGCRVADYGYGPAHSVSLEGLCGARLSSVHVRENLRIQTAEVAGRFSDGAPAVTLNRFGKGKALYFAAPLFMQVRQNPRREMSALLEAILGLAGVRRTVKVTRLTEAGNIEARVLSDGERHLLIAMNHDSAPARAAVSVSLPAGGGSVSDAETHERVPARPTEEGFALDLALDGLAVRLFQWEEK